MKRSAAESRDEHSGHAAEPSRALIGAPGLLVGAAAVAAGLALAIAQQARRAERRHPPIGRLIDVAGTKVHVHMTGDGPPLVLLHGNGAMVHDWVASGLVDRLRWDYRVIVIDRPGFGYTERPR